MKYAPIAAMLFASVAAPALADAPQEVAEEQAASLTIDTPIEELVADERSKAVLDKHIPGVDQHPAYATFKSMTLVQVQPFSQGAITEELLEKIAADLAMIGEDPAAEGGDKANE